jgi:hypothetical protein
MLAEKAASQIWGRKAGAGRRRDLLLERSSKTAQSVKFKDRVRMMEAP